MNLRDRRRASALQKALESYERALRTGKDPAEAAKEIARMLPGSSRLFFLATALPQAVPVDPNPRFVHNVAARLRNTRFETPAAKTAVARPRTQWRPRFAIVPLTVAATVLAAATILIPSFSSLPGDSLYAIKSAAEDTHVWIARGPAEARVRLKLADRRFDEVDSLIERSQTRSIGAVGAINVPIAAAAVDGINDPVLASLIEDTLKAAGQELETAAKILIEHPSAEPAADLDELVAVTSRGHALATKVAEDLPHLSQSPVFATVVKLAKIEAKAKAARMQVNAKPSLQPCETPAPSTTPDENATSTAVEGSPSPTPTATPEPTPCITPSPTPTPTPTATPTDIPEVSPTEPTATPTESASVNNAQGGQDAQQDGNNAQTSGAAPVGNTGA